MIQLTTPFRIFILMLGFVCWHSLAKAEAPSNEELYRMLLTTQQELAELRERTNQAEAEASKAKAEASKAKAELADFRQQIQSTEMGRESATAEATESLVGTNAEYSYTVLDHTRDTNTKQLRQLEALRDGELKNRLTIGGNINVIANYQKSNRDSKFGWLMRHPTSANQFGNEVSEAVIHSVNLQFTGRLTDRLTAYSELLYNPEQNFASGSTITGLPRNNINMRRAYVLYGDLNASPYYASIGKMDIPFGLNDTVSPFTNSTNWHSFAGLAYGAMLGYSQDDWHIRAMAVQGGAQFRNANANVHETSVPSKLNNFAVDLNRSFAFADGSSLLAGLSYQHGSAYCQEYEILPPGVRGGGGVQHFGSCEEDNPAVAGYLKYDRDKLQVIAEYAQTLKDWPGTHNPFIPQFEAEKNTTFTLGTSYDFDFGLESDVTLSFEFSRFIAGDDGSPWEKQDQFVLGAAYMLAPNVKVFSEAVHAKGWVPLNFLSGGNPGSDGFAINDESWSDQDATTTAIVFGLSAAY